MTISPRIALSMNRDEALWLERLLTRLRRGGDVRDMMCQDICTRVSALVYRASKRAEGQIPPTSRATLTSCINGHPYSKENTTKHGGYRRCVTCRRASWKRHTDKQLKQAREQRAAVAKLVQDEAADHIERARERREQTEAAE